LTFVNTPGAPTRHHGTTSTYQETAMFKRILVPVDGSETANKALVAALQLARTSGGTVRLVHSLEELAYLWGVEYVGDTITIAREQASKILDSAAAMARSAGVPSEQQLLEKPGVRLGDLIAGEALEWNADLIVVGTHGRRGLGRVLLGSGAEQIIRSGPVPVLVIRGDDRPVQSSAP
jgi:nucleotide-binding universal stress UspA family protein